MDRIYVNSRIHYWVRKAKDDKIFMDKYLIMAKNYKRQGKEKLALTEYKEYKMFRQFYFEDIKMANDWKEYLLKGGN